MTADTIAIVCGSRDGWREDWAFECLDAIDATRRIALVIEGGQRRSFEGRTVGGYDWLARRWALARDRGVVTYAAEWDVHGSRAGPIRNATMLRDGKPDLLIDFPGTAGSADMVTQALNRLPPLPRIEVARFSAFVYVPVLSPELCRDRRDALHVYGDNLEGWGTAGQACIRTEPNAVGIATKRAPRTTATAYFTDDDFETFRSAAAAPLARLRAHIEAGGTVFWPDQGIGTGLADLYRQAPRLFAAIERAEHRLREIGRQRAP